MNNTQGFASEKFSPILNEFMYEVGMLISESVLPIPTAKLL